MKRNFIILRHGQTNMNINYLLQGRSDTRLNKWGKTQAEDIKYILKSKGISFSDVIASPLHRTRETASIISGIDIDEIKTDERLIEMDFGDLEGKSYRDYKNEPGAVVFLKPENYVPQNGESYEDLLDRIKSFFDDMRNDSRESEDNTLIVTHGGVFHGILMYFNGYELKDFWKTKLNNCAIYKLTLNETGGEMTEIFSGFPKSYGENERE